jgi:DNA-binding MarR family transcriptional regulator
MYTSGVSTSSPASELVTYAARLVRVVSRVSDNPASLRLLAQLEELGPVTVTELARADRTAQPTTSAALRGLEERGLVARKPHPEDGRSSVVTLTAAGRSALADARAANGQVVTDLLQQYGVADDDVRTAVRVLKTLTTT